MIAQNLTYFHELLLIIKLLIKIIDNKKFLAFMASKLLVTISNQGNSNQVVCHYIIESGEFGKNCLSLSIESNKIPDLIEQNR